MNSNLFPPRRRSTGRATAAVVALALVSCLGTGLAQAAPLKLRLLATTDIHMNLVNYDYYQDKGTEQFGLAKTATLIKAARAEAKNSLLIDNGDLIQGSPMGEAVARVKPLLPGEVHPAFRVMNALKYDAAIDRMEGSEEIFGKLMADGEFRKLAVEHMLHKVYGALKSPKDKHAS